MLVQKVLQFNLPALQPFFIPAVEVHGFSLRLPTARCHIQPQTGWRFLGQTFTGHNAARRCSTPLQYHYRRFELFVFNLELSLCWLVSFWVRSAKLWKATINFVVPVRPSVHLSTWNSWAVTGQVVMMIDIWVLFDKMLTKLTLSILFSHFIASVQSTIIWN